MDQFLQQAKQRQALQLIECRRWDFIVDTLTEIQANQIRGTAPVQSLTSVATGPLSWNTTPATYIPEKRKIVIPYGSWYVIRDTYVNFTQVEQQIPVTIQPNPVEVIQSLNVQFDPTPIQLPVVIAESFDDDNNVSGYDAYIELDEDSEMYKQVDKVNYSALMKYIVPASMTRELADLIGPMIDKGELKDTIEDDNGRHRLQITWPFYQVRD